jgi:hypothetical protein
VSYEWISVPVSEVGERGVAPAIFLFDSFTVVSNINIKRTTLK